MCSKLAPVPCSPASILRRNDWRLGLIVVLMLPTVAGGVAEAARATAVPAAVADPRVSPNRTAEAQVGPPGPYGPDATHNWIFNSSAEAGDVSPEGWLSRNGDHTRTEWSTETAHSGVRSLKAVSSGVWGDSQPNWAAREINFDAYPFDAYPTRLVLGGWSKAEMSDLAGGVAQLWLVTDGYTDHVRGYQLSFSPGTHDWENREWTFAFPWSIHRVSVRVALSGGGTVWFDDIYLRVDPAMDNPGMEQGAGVPDGWSTYGNDLTREAGWDTEAHAGTRSLKIVNTTGVSAGWRGDPFVFTYPYPRIVTMGGWSKAAGVGPEGLYELDFLVEFEDGEYVFYDAGLAFERGTHDWEPREHLFCWRKAVKRITPFCLLYGTRGTAWFDDVYVRVEESGFANPSFEEGATSPGHWWAYDGWDLSPGTGWIDGVAHSGARSVVTDNLSGGFSAWVGDAVEFPEPLPRDLIFGGWSKAEAVAPGGLYELDVLVEFEDGSLEFFDRGLAFERGTHDWQKVEHWFTFGKGVRRVRAYCLLYGTTGRAYFDDLVLQSGSGLFNGSAEEGNTSPDGWSTYGNTLTEETGWTTETARLGSRSLKITNTDGGAIAGWQGRTIEFSPPFPTRLQLGGWSKALQLFRTTYLTYPLYELDFLVEFEDGSLAFHDEGLSFYDPQMFTGSPPGADSRDWMMVRTDLAFNKGVKRITPFCLLYGIGGSVWFDGIFATIVWQE